MKLPFVPAPAAAEAAVMDGVLTAIHAHILFIAIGWGALFLFVLWRFRRGAHRAARPNGPGIVWPAIAIGAVVAGDVLILATNALPAWNARLAGPPAALQTLQVRVIAEQFAWNVHYPGPDGVFGPTTPEAISDSNPIGLVRSGAGLDDIGLLNVLTVPMGRAVVIELSSRDVVHSFTLPEMRVKQDATPGMLTRAWFTPTRPGRWEIACSQLCGLGHYRMKGILTVLPDDEWTAWQAAEVARIDPPPAPRP